MAVYAVSDLHGQYDTFIRGLDKINFSDDDELYMIGDAIDRGPDSIRILQYIKDHDNMDLLIGNHEFMMLNSVDPNGRDKCTGYDSDLWLYYNGGNKTFREYSKLKAEMRKSILLWLNRRYVIKTVIVGDKRFCLTHSFYKPEFENKMFFEMDYDDIWSLVWPSVYRDGDTWRPFIYSEYDYTFITGHVPVQRVRFTMYSDDTRANVLQIVEDRNLIDIDGGCAGGYDSWLNNGAIFLRLDDMQVFTVPLTGIDHSDCS